ncbi:hypothetical protein KV102_03740 [Mumia sp. zg.B53]|uniref:hypothetical protein n=1 Tax=unclassified Mumia TaxID=2621872 RepID=UPI001C6E83B0|nr:MULTISPECIES: hypothetical protein [unclassified Mumia]MBW9204657.1 hypothetical protein [Mumia sp. zg.B17]MBW9209338.1 hypothetical protein [Mumia sp. zg.B21]MBW9213947.1 hypothetical protein [Mumia sp. zg.B53]MDD9349860.1 hypothetical protein [Mumia sp.]
MDAARTGGRTLTRTRLLAVALAAVVVAGVVVGVVALVRGPQIPAYADAAARQDVRAATEKFATSVNSYDVKDLDPYVARVKPLLTDDLAVQFEASTKDLLGQFADTGIVSKGNVEQVAIESIDDDSAEVLAAITVETEPKDVQVGQPRLRWRVALVREGDRWLVDSFTNVTVETAATPAPGAAPTPTPTQGSGS